MIAFLILVSHAADWTPTAAQASMIELLRVRDPAPACADVEVRASDAAGDDLRAIAENANQPPWVGMRAAECLLTGHPESLALDSWVVDPARRGLAILVVGRLDGLPRERALGLARAAMAGPHAADARPRVAKSADPDVRALVP